MALGIIPVDRFFRWLGIAYIAILLPTATVGILWILGVFLFVVAYTFDI